MITLAIDTSTARGAVAVLRDEQVLAADQFERLGGSAPLFGVIERVLQRSGWPVAAVTGYAVGIGPGSFAGIRGGIAAVKGLALPAARPILAVNSYDALALTAVPQRPPDCGPICVFGDAKRGEIYWALYDSAGSRLRPCALGTLEKIADEIHDPIWFVSSEIERFRQSLTELFGGFANVSPTPLYPSAAALGRLAWQRFAAGSRQGDAALEPIYLRAIEYKMIPPNVDRRVNGQSAG